MGTNSVLFYRFGLAWVIIAAVMAVRRESVKVSWKEFAVVTALGVLFTFSSLTLYVSFTMMAAGVASTILFTYPVMTAVIMATVFKERITWQTVAALVLSLAGVVTLYWSGKTGTLPIWGVVLVLISALTYALYIIVVDRSDLRLIFDQKQQMIKKAGILEMIPLKETIDDIGGLDNLKEWLRRKASVYRNIEKAKRFGVDMPKGVLIAGVPGCGKSLNAKAAAALFEIPLLRMDMGRLMGKYVGESEENMRNAIALTEAISPCVLWIDELEKAFAGIGGSGGAAEVTTRLFGNFLTWMQEKESPTFVVATANNIVQLPPELMRKGRFDEIFYVGLPTQTERENIFRIHIKKRRPQDMKIIDLKELARNTDGYSGADIEGVIKDAVEAAFADGKDHISTQDILDVIRTTHSLSEVMKDSIDAMEKEYKRCKFRNASSDRR